MHIGRFHGTVFLITLVAIGGTATARAHERTPFGERRLQIAPTRYEMDVSIDYETERVQGTAILTLQNVSDAAADHLPLMLYRMMRADGIRDADGRELEFDQSLQEYEDWPDMQVRYIEVPMEPALPPGETTRVAIDWSGELHDYTEAMAYVKDHISREYTVLRRETKAYPRVDLPNYRVSRAAETPEYDYLVRVDVPEDLVVANAGELVSVEKGEGRAIWTYRNLEPAWRMDFCVAPYEILEEGGLKLFYFPQDEEGARRFVREFDRAVATFTDWFGPLPDRGTLRVIEVPEGYGSQTDVTAILQTADAFRSEDSAHELYHEACHLWDLPPSEKPSPRWNEGVASFLERLLVDLYADDPELPEVERVAAAYRERLAGRLATSEAFATTPMIDYGKGGMTGYSYSGGMLMFGTFYHLLGAEDFQRVMGGYFAKYRDTGGSTDEFVAYADAAVDMDLKPFFRDWFYTTAWHRFLEGEWTLASMAASYR